MTLTSDRPAGVADRPLASPPSYDGWATIRTWIRDNRAFCLVAGLGTLLRVVVLVAYAPALEFFGDSPSYLHEAADLSQLSAWHPIGYPLLIWLTAWSRSLLAVVLLQHVLGVLAGALVYRLGRGLGLPSGPATVAALPLLLDAYQIDVEQFVLSDTLFTFLAVVCIVLCVRLSRQPTPGRALTLGLLLAATTLTRTVGFAVALPALAVLVAARIGWRRIATVAAGFALPLGAYALAFHAAYGVYGLQGYNGRYLYGVVAPVARCQPDPVADPLCPPTPPAARPGSNEYVWNLYPYLSVTGSPVQRSNEADAFARRVAFAQPGDVAGTIGGNFLHYFALTRGVGPRDWFVGSWQFPLPSTSPAWNIKPAVVGIDMRPEHGHIDAGAASVLRSYQDVAFVPGSALLVCLALSAAALVVRRRDGERQRVLLLLTGSGVLLLAIPAATAGFDWRYVLPAQALLVPAGVLALHMMWPAMRRRVGRALPWITAGVAAAVVTPNLVVPSVYAAHSLTTHRVLPMPGTASVGGRLDVTTARPTVLHTRCRWDQGVPRLGVYFAVPVAFDHRAGDPMLVQPGNFSVSNGSVLDSAPDALPTGPSIANVLLSNRYPQLRGRLYAFVWSGSGVLRYVDPVGGGAAAWRYELTVPRAVRLGSRCTGSGPWAGAVVPGLRLDQLPPFTLASSLPIGYRLTQEPWRARTFDLRMRMTVTPGGPRPWQYPPAWQRTPVRQQTLLDLLPGATYCFQVRGRDALGATTDWSAPECTTRLYDDASLPPGPGWTPLSGQAQGLDGTLTEADGRGAAISLAAPFTRAALLLYHCPQCGSVDVYAGPRELAHLDLRSPAATTGLRLWTSARLPKAASTLTLRVASSRGLVAIDAFGLAAP